MRRRILLSSSSGGGGSDAAPLDVAFYNGSDIVIRKQEYWVDGETPIGIVVVPRYHNRYGDGTCGIMSLANMDCNNPQTGAIVDSYTWMEWGYSRDNVGNNIFNSTTALTNSYGYIPYQSYYSSTACTVYTGNTVWPYAGTTTAPTSAASTSYTNTGGYVKAITGQSGCDFNGIRNTAALYVATRTSVQWTAATITDYSRINDTPAAACAGRFKTPGTKSFLDVFSGITSNDLNYGTSASPKENTGFWYLPGEGELCYLPRFRFRINNIIDALNEKYGNVGINLRTDYLCWSSSEGGEEDAWSMNMSNGGVTLEDKVEGRYVRAFMRL